MEWLIQSIYDEIHGQSVALNWVQVWWAHLEGLISAALKEENEIDVSIHQQIGFRRENHK